MTDLKSRATFECGFDEAGAWEAADRGMPRHREGTWPVAAVIADELAAERASTEAMKQFVLAAVERKARQDAAAAAAAEEQARTFAGLRRLLLAYLLILAAIGLLIYGATSGAGWPGVVVTLSVLTAVAVAIVKRGRS